MVEIELEIELQSINRKPGKGREDTPQWRRHAREVMAGLESRKQQIGRETKGDVSFNGHFNRKSNQHEIKDVDDCIANSNCPMQWERQIPCQQKERKPRALHERCSECEAPEFRSIGFDHWTVSQKSTWNKLKSKWDKANTKPTQHGHWSISSSGSAGRRRSRRQRRRRSTSS